MADDFENMSWSDLYQLRSKTKDPLQQALLAPYEHRAYAREQVAENPAMAPFYAAAVPAYQAFKSLYGTSRTPASLNQVTQGWTGVGEGLADWWKNR